MSKTTKKGGIILFSIFVFLPLSWTWADGGYVSKTESVAISADQRAILSKFGDYISMTFSTGYTGEGDDFGWIIPTPVPPALGDVIETGEDFFQFLDQVTAPIQVTTSRSGCFPAGTEVLTVDGLNPIETVSPGTEVYACDLTSDMWVPAKVIRRQAFEWEGDMVTIEMGRHTLQATGNQPVYVVRGERLSSRPIPQEVSIDDRRVAGQGRWVEARDLEEGDVLKKKGGDALIVTGLTSVQQTCRVYCLEVEQYHNCAVHREGILVHNSGKEEAASEGSSEPLVTVYGRVTLEHYEVSVLGAADASALLEWLQLNDYQIGSESKEVFDGYIERNWGFVAVKLNPSEKRRYENEFLPPLMIKYQYSELIFPLLISSISTTGQIKITLYVHSDGAVTSSNFPIGELEYKDNYNISEEYVESCIRNTIRNLGGGPALVILWRGRFSEGRERGRLGEAFEHPTSEFLVWYTGNQNNYITRLEARMNPADMTEDISFEFAPTADYFEVGSSSKSVSAPRTSNIESRPILIIAARNRHDEPVTVQRLLKGGAEVDERDEHGWTPLMHAASQGKYQSCPGSS